jgi:tripartite-type tricarboxylate transporter receptor subunit TctC
MTTKGPGRRDVTKALGAALAGTLASPFIWRPDRAWAAWPNDKPVRIIVANTPGGPSDISARLLAPVLQEALGGTFIIENRPGGGGTVGMLAAARAEPDGYTLHVSTGIYVMAPSLYEPPPYDWKTALIPVAEIGSSPSVFAVQPTLGVNTLKEAVALAKKDQSKFNIGSPPIGSTLYLGAELIRIREGLKDVAIVLHQGGGQNVQALLSGTLQMISSSLAPAHAHIKAGTLKGLAILGPKRWHDLPDMPTSKEAGYDDFVFETTTGLLAPNNLPAEILAKIEKAAVDGLRKPDISDKLVKAGFFVEAKGAKEHGERLAREHKQFAEIIKAAGIKPKPI